MLTAPSLIAELDVSLAAAPASWRHDVLRRVVDPFLGNVELYADDHVGLFDDVIGRLIVDIERAPLVELSNRLAPAAKAPVNVVGALARHRDPAIYGPVLTQARALPDHDLVEIAGREQTNLDALTKIAARAHLSEAVTDVLLKIGNTDIRWAGRQRQRAHIGNGLCPAGRRPRRRQETRRRDRRARQRARRVAAVSRYGAEFLNLRLRRIGAPAAAQYRLGFFRHPV